ncbi:maleylpyruvate isomerase N-terminal domain-containing protein [Knoellia koreensis]|uniref:Maleylpyruvate isomerase n=1 Tax=Knoellia koreensis TaxID=2730921 RepID=A0A849HBZ2_9MICO|nr:maleylpyruvate isomerase N-terminal domain-containing protein [Knoellia sp. DB2414S]NNM44569.1 maleylpyruvate isomerase [Knoellia sp. DB2414S]
MPLTVELETVRDTARDSVNRFVEATVALSEYDLLGASRCHGWSRLDVVVHVVGGWAEMLGGLVSRADRPTTVDAASYWAVFTEQYGDDDPVATLMSQRRRASAYLRPSSALEQLRDVAAMVDRGVHNLTEGHYLWQDCVFTAGDFLTIWVVEDVIHQLDLDSPVAPPAPGLALARQTIEAIVGEPLPADWSDTEAVLVGTGRVPGDGLPERVRELLPALG